jgi:FKBP-type peptidyl-prolyl cis-trans isomerase
MTEQEGGVVVEVLAEPDLTRTARDGDVVMIHYTGKLEDGTVFDTSRQIRPNQREPFPLPLTIRLGDGVVIKGWEVGLQGMKLGEKRRLTIPPEMGYGERGFPPVIPQNATLVFDVELVGLARPESE